MKRRGRRAAKVRSRVKTVLAEEQAEAAAFAILGGCNWVAWWRRARPELSTGQIRDLIADLMLQGPLLET
ncbi:MAG: hypothetical protein ACYDGN_15320 [Acidimicrobiales bacterium]